MIQRAGTVGVLRIPKVRERRNERAFFGGGYRGNDTFRLRLRFITLTLASLFHHTPFPSSHPSHITAYIGTILAPFKSCSDPIYPFTHSPLRSFFSFDLNWIPVCLFLRFFIPQGEGSRLLCFWVCSLRYYYFTNHSFCVLSNTRLHLHFRPPLLLHVPLISFPLRPLDSTPCNAFVIYCDGRRDSRAVPSFPPRRSTFFMPISYVQAYSIYIYIHVKHQ